MAAPTDILDVPYEDANYYAVINEGVDLFGEGRAVSSRLSVGKLWPGGRGVPGPVGPTGPAGPTGPSGSSLVVPGFGAPTSGVGVDGAIYIDIGTGKFYGPKASGAWPSTPIGMLATDAMTYDQLAKGGT